MNIVQKKNFKKTEKRYNNNDKFRKYPQTVGRIWKNENTVHKSPNSHSHSDRKCYKCGIQYPHDGSCPAIGQRCRKCRGMNHFQAVFKKQEVYKQDKINTLETLDAINSIDKDYIFSMQGNDRLPSVDLTVQGIEAKFVIDTGASINVLDDALYRGLKPQPKLVKHDKPIYAFNSSVPLKVEGKIITKIQYIQEIEDTEMIVMKTSGRNLLNYTTSAKLSLIQMLNVVETTLEKNNLDHWRKKYPSVFSGQIGKLHDFQLSLHIDSSVTPIQAASRNHPFHLRQAIEKQIKLMLEQDIIEEVTGEPTSWLSETVYVRKHNLDEIRICIDMKAANQAISREKFEMPNVENLIYKADGMKKLNKIDLMSAFQQIELNPDCRHISSFRTHLGIFRFKRLFFGIK